MYLVERTYYFEFLILIISLFPAQSTSNFKATMLLIFFKLNQQYFFTVYKHLSNY